MGEQDVLVRIASRSIAVRTLLAAAIVASFAVSTVAQDKKLTKMRAEYAAEDNPVKKAKTLAKLGPREITAIRDLVKDGKEDQALASLEQYRDTVMTATDALVHTGIDAVRHSGGFKELQISLRTSIRRLDDLILSVQQDLRASFRAVRSDLETAQNSLIDALFPVRTPKRTQSARSQ
jgi:hypothetical protein